MDPTFVKRRKYAARILIGAPILTTLGVLAGPNIIKEVSNDLKEPVCTGEQLLEVNDGSTVWSMSQNVLYDESEISKDDVVHEVIDMNPGIKLGSLITGQTIKLPLECHKN